MNLEKQFLNILERRTITTKFQPIVHLKTGDVLGFEAFGHGPKNSDLSKTKELRRIAKKLKKLWELEMLFRTSAFGKSQSYLGNKFLFLSVEPALLYSPNFHTGFTRDRLKLVNINPENIVFEISQKTIVNDYEEFKGIHKHYKDQNYKTAVTKVGDSHIALQGVGETQPDFVKIDKKMISDINTDKHKQTIIKSFVRLSRTNNFKVIAKGIQTKEEFKTLMEMGVHYGQGDFLCLKKPTLPECLENMEHHVSDVIYDLKQSDIFASNNHTVRSLIEKVPVIEQHTSCEDVNQYFKTNQHQTIAVLDANKPLGLISKSSFDSKLSTRYGYSLFSKKPISEVLGDDTLIIDASTPIYDAGQMALQRTSEYDDIMILDKGKYVGIVTMRSIISYTIDYERNMAKNLNPLTSLPGNTSISKTLNSVIHSNVTCGVFYVDIDNFKVYNDIYGFEAGDSIISLVSSILKKIITIRYPRSSFVGHVGGDDFVFVVEATEKEYYHICTQILNEFDEQIKYYFKADDLGKGCFEATDRYNNTKYFPLTSLTIAGIYGYLSRFQSEADIAKACAYIKGEVKKSKGSNYLLNKIVSAEESLSRA